MHALADRALTRGQTNVRYQAEHGRTPGVKYEGTWYFRRHQIEVVANAQQARRWADV